MTVALTGEQSAEPAICAAAAVGPVCTRLTGDTAATLRDVDYATISRGKRRVSTRAANHAFHDAAYPRCRADSEEKDPGRRGRHRSLDDVGPR
jgi:hypothetical protein